MFLIRLGLDAAATALLLAGLAYWWLGNFAHELIGAGMFLLLLIHNLFNRRAWGNVTRGRYDSRRRLNITIILLLAAAMVGLLITSVVISRNLFGLYATGNVSLARRVHSAAAFWALVVVALHLGTRWTVVMASLRNAFGLRPGLAIRTLTLRLATLGIALHGVRAMFEMTLASKLLMLPALDMWDFSEATAGFFLNYLAIMVTIGAASRYGMLLLARMAGLGRTPAMTEAKS